MAYSAVKGGREAVEQAAALLEQRRGEGSAAVELEALEKRMGLLIDLVMGEAGFYAPRYAALALKQSEGSPEEAVFLLRAYRSTLSRSYRSLPLDGADMRLLRRISAAFKDIPGGQFLGATYDYTHRLLDFDLERKLPEPSTVLSEKEAAPKGSQAAAPVFVEKEETPRDVQTAAVLNEKNEAPGGVQAAAEGLAGMPRVSERLRAEGLVEAGGEADEEAEPWDITRLPLPFPAPRSARLQALARADSGFIGGLAYAAIRGFGPSHPTVGELRTGALEVVIPHPLIEGEYIVAGDIILTETETLFPQEEAEAKQDEEDPLRILGSGQGERADESTRSLTLASGYGMVFGRNDTKAIAMSILDYTLSLPPAPGEESILQNQEFVLLHGDCLEMSGFISHLKLPHYVTFQSKLDRVRHSRQHSQAPDGEGAGL